MKFNVPKVLIPLAQGFEEIEAITLLDLLRRAEISTFSVSLTSSKKIRGSHGIEIQTDGFLSSLDKKPWDAIVLPGGMPGTNHLLKSKRLIQLLHQQNQSKRWIGAICAAPIVLGRAGLLRGKKAICYPGFEKDLLGAKIERKSVVVDQNILTSQGPGTAIDFALVLIEKLQGRAKAQKIRKAILR